MMKDAFITFIHLRHLTHVCPFLSHFSPISFPLNDTSLIILLPPPLRRYISAVYINVRRTDFSPRPFLFFFFFFFSLLLISKSSTSSIILSRDHLVNRPTRPQSIGGKRWQGEGDKQEGARGSCSIIQRNDEEQLYRMKDGDTVNCPRWRMLLRAERGGGDDDVDNFFRWKTSLLAYTTVGKGKKEEGKWEKDWNPLAKSWFQIAPIHLYTYRWAGVYLILLQKSCVLMYSSLLCPLFFIANQ